MACVFLAKWMQPLKSKKTERFSQLPPDSDGFVAEWFNGMPKRKQEYKYHRHYLEADDFSPPKPSQDACTVEASVPGIQGLYGYPGGYDEALAKQGYTKAQWKQDLIAYHAELKRYNQILKRYNRLIKDYSRKAKLYPDGIPCAVEERIGVKPTPGKDYWALPDNSDGYISEHFNGFPKPTEP